MMEFEISETLTMSEAILRTVNPARIESLKVWNYRALAQVEFKQLAPMTVLLGPNGSGKSTVFYVLVFLVE